MDAADKERVSVKKLRLVEWREERREGDGVVEPPSLPGDRTWTRATQLHCGIVLHHTTLWNSGSRNSRDHRNPGFPLTSTHDPATIIRLLLTP